MRRGVRFEKLVLAVAEFLGVGLEALVLKERLVRGELEQLWVGAAVIGSQQNDPAARRVMRVIPRPVARKQCSMPLLAQKKKQCSMPLLAL